MDDVTQVRLRRHEVSCPERHASMRSNGRCLRRRGGTRIHCLHHR